MSTPSHGPGASRPPSRQATAPESTPCTSAEATSRAAAETFVDWQAAVAVAQRLVNSGPRVSAEQATLIVDDLREAAAGAHAPVAETSRLHTDDPGGPVLVVDRRGWIEANAATLAYVMAPVIQKVISARESDTGKPVPTPNAAVAAIGSKVTGAETGAILAFMASRVLGQYDLAPQAVARLLLVAPNIVSAEREMGVDPHDFRRWVALHEETHRVQFTAVPWLRRHLIERTTALGADLVPTPQDLAARLGQIARGLPDAFRNGAGLAEIFATPEQRAAIAQITATMSLLEGHADVVMDEVGPAVVPTVATIRERFDTRRRSAGGLDRLLRRMMGLDAKMRQYRDGASFVRGVQEKVGVDGFNAVWTAPQTLPTPQEIAEPGLWVTRVHG